LILLAPKGVHPAQFVDVRGDQDLYENTLAEMQRFRGRVYVSEGNLAPADLSNGRHFQAIDYKSWHLVTIDECGSVVACSRLVCHRPHAQFSELLVSHTALAHNEGWGRPLRSAVEGEIRSARQAGMQFAELGGWAVSRELRCSTEAVRMLLSGYALGEVIGGIRGITTANIRHNSSSILRRIGGSPLQMNGSDLPTFYEPQYRSELEILRFDSSQPNLRYRGHIDQCRAALQSVMVISSVSVDIAVEMPELACSVMAHTAN
jgi:predicted GNAT family N-acyltransferase